MSPHPLFSYQPETMEAAKKVPADTVNAQSHRRGMEQAEPIIVILDSLLRYAKAYEKANKVKLSADEYLGKNWKSAIEGARRLLNGDGAVTMNLGITTDSKDNGACWDIYEAALKAAGFPVE